MADFKSLKNLNKDDQNIQDYLTALEQDRMEKGVSNLPLATFQTKSSPLPEATDLDSILARKQALRSMSKQPYSAGEPGLEEPIASPLDLIPMGAVSKTGSVAAKRAFKALKSLDEVGAIGARNYEEKLLPKAMGMTPKSGVDDMAREYFSNPEKRHEYVGLGTADEMGVKDIKEALEMSKNAVLKKGGQLYRGVDNPATDSLLKAKGYAGELDPVKKIIRIRNLKNRASELGIEGHELEHLLNILNDPKLVDDVFNNPNQGVFTMEKLRKLEPLLREYKDIVTPEDSKMLLDALSRLSSHTNEMVRPLGHPELYEQINNAIPSLPLEDQIKAELALNYKHMLYSQGPEKGLYKPSHELGKIINPMVEGGMTSISPGEERLFQMVNDPRIFRVLNQKKP